MHRIAVSIGLIIAFTTISVAKAARITELDPNFTKAYLLEMDSGRDFFSCAGHMAIRMRSETLHMDKCFSYESEPLGKLLFRFLTDNLKMGMFGLPTSVFLEPYQFDKRGVRQYRLNLPPDVKRALWILLDEKVEEGIQLKYNYIDRGCAQSMLRIIIAAANKCGKPLVFPKDKPYYHWTYRESFAHRIKDFPWYLCALHLIGGIDVDKELPATESAVIPCDVADMLRGTTIDGLPVIENEGLMIVPHGFEPSKTFFTPNLCAMIFLIVCVLTIICTLRWQRISVLLLEILQAAMLTWQLFVGTFLIYMVFFSDVPGSNWNWLLIPINPLIVVFWKWRNYWKWGYAGAIAIWIVGMTAMGHQLTYPTYIILSVAFALLTLASAPMNRKIVHIKR